MNEDLRKTIEDAYREMATLIIKGRQTIKKNKDELLMLAEDIICAQVYFVSYKRDAEAAFHQRVRELEAEGRSNSSAQDQAKGEIDYRIYKKCDELYALAEEQIRILKIAGSN